MTAPLQARRSGTIEARRLAEIARAAGLGDSPDDALQLHQEALTLLGTDQETTLVADVLRWQGSVLRHRSRISDAEPLYQRSLNLSVRLGYDAGHAHALNCLASLAQRRGDVTGAAGLLTDALLIANRCGDLRLVGFIQQNLGIIADIRGNPAASLAHYLVSLRTFETSNDLQSICWVLNNLGYLQAKEGQFVDARESFERALGIARARGDLMSEGTLEENRAELALIEYDLVGAERSIHRALEISRQRDDDVRRAAALKLHGARQRLTGCPELALDTLQRALTLSAVGEDALLGAETLYQFALALREAGRDEEGNEVLRTALESFERLSARQWVGRTRRQLTNPSPGRYL
jgi:tetratricopeptide (TPR) repeat protein